MFGGRHPIVVAEEGGRFLAFAATSTYRARACYDGVAELRNRRHPLFGANQNVAIDDGSLRGLHLTGARPGGGPYALVPLCGHATLAAAHVLWETERVPAATAIAFETLSGRLGAERESDGWIRLDFPALPPQREVCAPPPGLLSALGLPSAAALGVYEVPRPSASDGPSWLVELTSLAALRALAPDFRALRAVAGHAVIATARGEGEHDFASRFLAPKAGVDEDPVTGSAHCSLAPFWCARLGRSELCGVQLSARTGVVRVRARGARVHLLGEAVTVLRGELRADS